MVPRVTGERPVIREYTVVRCDLRPDGRYAIGLQLIDDNSIVVATDLPAGDAGPRTSNGSQLKLIMLAFALVCLLIALFMPL
jgi:hypothetical protein